MNPFSFRRFLSVAIALIGLSGQWVACAPLSPESIAVSSDGGALYIAERTANRIAVLDVETLAVRSHIPLPSEPTGLALSPDSQRLYVTCAGEKNMLCAVDAASREILYFVPVGCGATSPVLRGDERRLYVCNRFEDSLSVIDLTERCEIQRVPTGRDPFTAVLSKDGQFLFIGHRLPAAPADRDYVAASVSVMNARGLQPVGEIDLPNGSTALNQLCLSPDGRYVFATHLLGHFQMPTTQLERGWIVGNALTLIDARERKYVNTVLLDSVDRGAAVPWGMACTPDGERLCIAHSGTGELSVVDLPGMLEKLNSADQSNAYSNSYSSADYGFNVGTGVTVDLTFLVDVRERIRLQGKGPRGVAVSGSKAFVTNYYSNDLNVVDFTKTGPRRVRSVALGEPGEASLIRWGEQLFHDATLCFQGWLSCASCHPDGRADGLNWDLLNDGLGNPKNTKSLLYSHVTPPAMSVGVREDAETAVRSGFRHILFTVRPDEEIEAVDAYLKSMRHDMSPVALSGAKQESVLRGMEIFYSPETRCASCHHGPYYTDLKIHDVGTKGRFDRNARFDNPSLIELWRTAPYLHDGRAATLRDVLTACNPNDRHGRTGHLNERELADLEAFLQSL